MYTASACIEDANTGFHTGFLGAHITHTLCALCPWEYSSSLNIVEAVSQRMLVVSCATMESK